MRRLFTGSLLEDAAGYGTTAELNVMPSSSRIAFLERGLGAAAIVIGRTVTRAAGMLPRVVGRASGLAEPSPEAVVAGVVRGVTALAPLSLPVGGRAIELAGAASVLALATWTLEAELDERSRLGVLAAAIAHVEEAGLCGSRAALLWRITAGLPFRVQVDLSVSPMAAARSLLPDVHALGRSAAWSLARKAAVHALGTATPLHLLDAGRAATGAWGAMGDAARLVDATRWIAAAHASPDDGALSATGPRAQAA